jgi:hypothetical protein
MTKRDCGEYGPCNGDRADWAEHALAVFCSDTGLELEIEKGSAVSDLLCNLGHYCDVHDLDFLAIAAVAIGIWDAEVREEQNGEPNAMYPEKKVFIELGYPRLA